LKNNLNLVIIDDDKVQRYAIKRQLSRSKYKFTIFEADCGETALKILEKNAIDCIIVDYVLPQYDGLIFVERVKKKFGQCPPFLFMTSFGTGDVVRRAFKNGCFDYISKDKLNTQELLNTILALAEHSQHKTEISEQIENLELLAAEVTHDLNSPLRSMHYSVSQLIEDEKITSSEHLKSHIINIKSNIFNMGNILNDIANGYASKEKGGSFSVINFNDLVNDVIESITHVFPNKVIHFSVNALPLIRGDKSGLFRIFYNLVSNSIKYNDKDIILINIYHQHTTLYDEIIIEDNGIGMSPDSIKDIFKPFYRTQSLENTIGTGLGLAICKRIIDQHNGKIFVESVPGKGSTFKIALPRSS
jgi:hypothetical protein